MAERVELFPSKTTSPDEEAQVNESVNSLVDRIKGKPQSYTPAEEPVPAAAGAGRDFS